MIRYYDNLAAYEADVKSTNSQVSLIGNENAIKYDGRNVVVGICSAKTGSIAYLDDSKALCFISVDSFNSASFASSNEIVGVVRIGVDHPSFRGQIAIMNKTFEAKKMSNIYQHRLTGYTCDGTARTGVLSIREASDSWTANHDYVISYNAANELALVAQLNTYFKSNEPFKTQQWQAVLNNDNTIDLRYAYTDYRQAIYNKGTTGFALTANLLPEWIATTSMLRMNGQRSGEGTIMNWSRALAYFRNDISSTTYNPAKDVTSTKISYPICLPGYLGTSAYQSDHCSYLRSIYGEGEEGWLKFMASFLPVRPTEYGSNGDKEKYGDVKKNTYYLASAKYVDVDGNTQPVSPAADFVANIHYDHELLKRGRWVIPDSDLIYDVIGGVEYPTTNDRNADVINRALKTIGAPAFRNDVNIWSCSRFGAYLCWIHNGSNGFLIGGNLYQILYTAVPLAIIDVH